MSPCEGVLVIFFRYTPLHVNGRKANNGCVSDVVAEIEEGTMTWQLFDSF